MKPCGPLVVCCLLLSACGSSAPAPPNESVAQSPAAGAASPTTPRMSACSLFTKAEVEALLNRRVVDGRGEDVAEESNCDYGNPELPMVNGRATDSLLILRVFSGTRPNQARGVYDIAKTNAAGVQEVSGLGEVAFWDNFLRTLRTVKNNYHVEIVIGSNLGGLNTTRAIAEKALAKLP